MKERKDSRVTEIRSPKKKRETEIPGKQRNVEKNECFKLKAAAFGPKKKNSQTEISWKDLQQARKTKGNENVQKVSSYKQPWKRNTQTR